MPLKRTAAVFLFAAALTTASAARATDKKVCISAFEETQRLRTQNKLIAARDQLQMCTDPACPALVRKNCAQWMEELSTLVPSLVFAVHGADGQDHADGSVAFDGAPLGVQLGQPLPCDPGVHHIRVEAPGFVPIEQDIVVKAGEQNRRLDVTLQRVEVPPPPPPVVVAVPPPTHERRWLAPALAGAGVGFVALGIIGVITTSSDLGDMRRTCAPACDPANVSALNARIGLSAASFVVGAAALGAAAWFFTHRPPTRTVGGEPFLTF